MQMQSFRVRVFALVGVFVLAFSAAARADPPSRVARLGYTSGAVSFSPAGENDWVQATVNRPLTNGDRLWVDAGARAEIQDGGAMIRLNANTSVSVLNLDDRITQLQLTQGVMNVRVRRLAPNQVFEVDTPNLAVTLRQSGDYRIAVDPDSNATDVIVRKGQGEVMGEGAGYLVDAQQRYRFRGGDLRDYEFLDAPRQDEFDRWALERDRAFDNSIAARYVSRDVVGFQDLDANGNWQLDQTYGNVWVPNRVAADWAPYRDGHWAWIDPWGWTWVDDAPWGFAVSHYGRWANLGHTWCWVPGPMRSAAYYAPALVVFVGGDNFRLTISSGNVGGVAWFPLAPREAYRPAYSVSRGYFENINRSNTVISNTVINNTYNVTNVTNVVYANQRIPGAVVAVPRNTFVQSQSVSGSRVRVNQEQLANAPLAGAPRVAPTEQSVRGGGDRRERPPGRVFERPVIAVTAPPAAHYGFAAQQRQLTLNPGKPLDEAARRELKPAVAVPATVVKVLNPTSGASQPQAVRPQPAPQAPVASPTGPRSRPEQRGNDQQRVPATAAPVPMPAPAPLQRAPEPKVVAPQVAPPVSGASSARGSRPESARVNRQTEPTPTVAAPRPPPSQPQQQQQQQQQPQRQQQRAPEPKTVAPVSAPPAQPAPKAEPAAAIKQVEPRAPVAATKPPPPPPSPTAPPPAQPAPKAEPQGQRPAPAASKPHEAENGRDAPKRDEENRKPKN